MPARRQIPRSDPFQGRKDSRKEKPSSKNKSTTEPIKQKYEQHKRYPRKVRRGA